MNRNDALKFFKKRAVPLFMAVCITATALIGNQFLSVPVENEELETSMEKSIDNISVQVIGNQTQMNEFDSLSIENVEDTEPYKNMLEERFSEEHQLIGVYSISAMNKGEILQPTESVKVRLSGNDVETALSDGRKVVLLQNLTENSTNESRDTVNETPDAESDEKMEISKTTTEDMEESVYIIGDGQLPLLR